MSKPSRRYRTDYVVVNGHAVQKDRPVILVLASGRMKPMNAAKAARLEANPELPEASDYNAEVVWFGTSPEQLPGMLRALGSFDKIPHDNTLALTRTTQ